MNSRWLRKTLVLQHDQSDCGAACLNSIIKYHGGEATLENTRNLSGTSIRGTTLLGLYNAAQQLGFDAEGIEVENINHLDMLDQPVILHVLIDDKLQHYLVYYAKDRDHNYIVGDPAKGISTYKKETIEAIWKTRTLLKLTPNHGFQNVRSNNQIKRRWLFDLVFSDLNLLLIALFLGITMSLLGISSAIFLRALIDDILPNSNMQKLWIGLSTLTLLLVARSLVGYLRGFFLGQQARDFNNRIIATFYSSLLNLPKSFFDTRNTGELIARMNDTRRIQLTISFIASNLVIDLLLILVSLIAIVFYSWIIGVLLLVAIPLYILIANHFNARITSCQKDVMQGYAASESNYVDSIQGIEAIKANNREQFFENLNKRVYGTFQDKLFNLGLTNIQCGTIAEITGVVISASIFGLTSFMVLNKTLQVGEMVALLGLVGNSIPSFTRIAMANVQIQEAKIAFNRMFEYTHMSHSSNDKIVGYLDQDQSKVTPEGIDLKVEKINFRYPGQRLLLKNFSISIMQGETIAILGESGVGKSTLLQVLQKFYLAEGGTIDVSGIDWSHITKSEWCSQIAAVPQEIKIFNGSLLYNITLSDRPEEFEKAMNLCRKLGLETFFAGFPQGYYTSIGESGINISGGQRQLVGLARALVKKPRLLLLDEFTASLDRLSEGFIISLLQRLKSEMAILMITHKTKIAQLADRIYIIEKGEVVTSGTPMDLMETSNFFSDSVREATLQSTHKV